MKNSLLFKKPQFYIIWLVTLIFLSNSSCKKEEKAKQMPTELPKNRMSGFGTFACKINGKVWVNGYYAEDGKRWENFSKMSSYIDTKDNILYVLPAAGFDNDLVNFYLEIPNFNRSIPMKDGKYLRFSYETTIPGSCYCRESNKVVIDTLFHDKSRGILSCKFFAELYGNSDNYLQNDTIRITEGFFDIKY